MMTLDDYLLAYKEGRLSEPELREQIKKLREASPRSPLSEGQKGLWVEYGRTPSANYNIQMGFAVREKVSVESLRRAYEFTLAQHPILRSVIEEVEGIPYQRADASSSASFTHEDWTGRGLDEAVSYLNEQARRPFSLNQGPLIKMHLLSLAPEEHVALLVVHHLVFDGASWPLLLSTLLGAYAAIRRGESPAPAPAPSAYKDFVQWEQLMLRSKEAAAHRAYWERQLATPLPVLEVPADRPRPPVASAVQTHTFAHVLSAAQSARVEEQCRSKGLSVATYLLGVFKLLLHRYTNERDLIVGMPTLGRPQAEFEGLIGYFVNMIAVRSRVEPRQTFSDFVRALRGTVTEGLAHAAYPFPRVVRDLKVPREQAPIFQVGYSYQNASLFGRHGGRARPSSSALPIELLDGINQEGPFGEYELALEARELDDTYDLALKYDAQVFDRPTMARMMSHYTRLLDGVLADPERQLNSYSMLSEEESDQLLVRWNETAVEYPAGVCVHELFEEQVRETPHATALVHGEQQLTYAELDERANRLARYLRSLGVGPDHLVAVCAERSPEMIVAILGTLKAGGAYLPLDPGYPAERLRYMLGDASPRVLLTQERLQATLPETTAAVVALDAQWPQVAEHGGEGLDAAGLGLAPQHLAFVVYTSGSTGRPKGIAMPHASLVNLIQWHRQTARASRAPRTLHFAALGFDVAFQEIFATLCVGAPLVLVEEEARRDPQALAWLLRDRKVQRAFLPFSALRNIAPVINDAKERLPSLEDVISAGEQLHITPAIRELFKRHPSCRLHNHYGPAEVHVIMNFTMPDDPDEWVEFPPIGRPTSNVRIYILDEARQPVPVGVRGEIYIGGVAISRGYLNRPGMTAERYVPDPFSREPGARLYKTGDVARYMADGNIEFAGRNDEQVKIRGFRVELGEVESQLRRHERVKEAVVVAREDAPGNKRLVAYLTRAGEEAPGAEDLRAHLKSSLPDYMIPTAFVTLEAFPLSPNGKLDRKALPAPGLDAYAAKRYAAPEGEAEQAVARVWQKLLRIERVGRDDNFFELGGHSLLAMQVVARLREELAVELSANALFDHQTVAALAEYLRAASEAKQLTARRADSENPQRQRGVL